MDKAAKEVFIANAGSFEMFRKAAVLGQTKDTVRVKFLEGKRETEVFRKSSPRLWRGAMDEVLSPLFLCF
jgi:hypothetical protein